jgi:hypothetical protein
MALVPVPVEEVVTSHLISASVPPADGMIVIAVERKAEAIISLGK